MKWKQLSSVLCDRKVPVKTKGKVYKTAVRPALLYGSERWAPHKKHYTKLHTTEMKMLRWAGGVTLMDKVQNKHIRGSMKVTPIEGKIKEARMRWYGHVMRRDDDHIVRKTLDIQENRRGRERPHPTWRATVEKDMREQNLEQATVQDRRSWRLMMRRADPK
jgi:hypothetical protein